MSSDKKDYSLEKDISLLDPIYAIDILADEAGGYVLPPREDDIAFLELLFETSERLGIHYYKATAQERSAVEEEALSIWDREHGNRAAGKS